MPRLLLALPLAFLICASPAHADSANLHASAARKAVRSKSWNKALQEWQAAYRLEPNSDFLVGMGDAYAAMGDKANARKQYNAYLADPLALDGDGVKAKLAALDKPAGGDDLSLDLSGPAPASASNDLGLDLGGSPADSGKSKKSKKAKKEAASSDDLSLDLSGPAPAKQAAANNDLGLDLGSAPAPAPAKKAAASNDLGLDLGPAPAPAPAKKDTKAVASNDLGLDFGTPAPAPAKAAPAPAKVTPPPAKIAVATTTRPAAPPPVPPVAMTHPRPPPEAVVSTGEPRVIERNNRVIAYCTAGLAVGALAVGGLYYTKASQDQTDLTSQIRPGAQQQALIEQQKTNKSLALAGILTGVVLAGVTTAIFVF